MNYPKIGGARVFALGNVIHVVDAEGGKPLLFNHTEARELAKTLHTWPRPSCPHRLDRLTPSG